MSKYMNEKELRQEIYECVPFCIDSEIKYYDTIFIDGDMYPVFIFDFDLVYGICLSDVKFQNLKMKKCIFITNETLNKNLFNEILYHEIGHCVFEKYSKISNYRYPTIIEEIFCDYYSYLKCGESYFRLQKFLDKKRIRILRQLIKRNIDLMNLLNTVKIRYQTAVKIYENHYDKQIKIKNRINSTDKYLKYIKMYYNYTVMDIKMNYIDE